MIPSPLTPTPIVDKNGRSTIVHKRASSASSTKPIPSPVAPAALSGREVLMERFDEAFDKSWCPKVFINELEAQALRMKEPDLTHLVGWLEQRDPTEDGVYLITRTFERRRPEEFSPWMRRVDDHYYPLIESYCDLVRGYQGDSYVPPSQSSVSQGAVCLIAGLETYARSGLDLTMQQESDLCAVANALHFEEIIRSNHNMRSTLIQKSDNWGERISIYLGSSELISYVIDHPEQRDFILKQIADPAVTREPELMHRLAGLGNALSDGAL